MRMCVDYKDLNKACPKDFYPLPNIDRMIDTMAGHEILSFLDAYSGYNQIQMDLSDQEKHPTSLSTVPTAITQCHPD